MTSKTPSTAHDGCARLEQLGVIQAEGADAAHFLHGQLTQDISALTAGEARLAALCNPKGRMLASFVVLRPEPERILLVCSRDLLAPTLKRLSMFVLRAKVRLTDVSNEWSAFGLLGSALAANGVDAARAPWLVSAQGAALAVSLYPADGMARCLWLAPADAVAPVGDAMAESLWCWTDVRSGVATLSAPVVEAFVPQMLNYESVGGVNFQKGCYPGQEVVARSQFRGTLKRRAAIASSSGALEAGQDVFRAVAGGANAEPVGVVAQAAPGPDGRFGALVCLQTSALDSADLRVGGIDGEALQLDPLPYALRDDL